MKKILHKGIVWSLMLSLSIVEWVFAVLIKISTVAAGLLINVLVICIFICICTREWTLLGVLVLGMVCGLLFICGQATILYFLDEARERLKQY